jgi:hypothetical protein
MDYNQRMVIDGDTVYEIDDECEQEKEKKEQQEQH